MVSYMLRITHITIQRVGAGERIPSPLHVLLLQLPNKHRQTPLTGLIMLELTAKEAAVIVHSV